MEFFLGACFGFFLFYLLNKTFLGFCIRSVTKSWFGRSEFFDQQELLLNLNRDSSWANLGFWLNTEDYPTAAKNLAMKLGDACHLDRGDRIADIGFGNGDQIRLWLDHYRVDQVHGFNISSSQTEYAKKTLDHRGNCNLQIGSFENIPRDQRISKILALDCAYHFPSRGKFFEFCHETLPRGGSLGLVDLTIGKPNDLIAKLVLFAMASASKIPRKNLWDDDQYRGELEANNFSVIHWENISDQVFVPFSQFVSQHRMLLNQQVPKDQWYKYRITGWLLPWLHRKGLISLNLIAAQRN